MASYGGVILVLLINFFYHTMNQMFVPTLPLYITQLGGGEVVVGVLVGLLSLGAVLGKVYFGKLATRTSNLLVLRVGLVVATGVLFLYLPFWGFGFLALVRLLQSIGLAGFITGGQGLLAAYSKPSNRGLFFGIFAATIGLGMMVGPLFGSYLMENLGFSALFLGASAVVGVAMLLSFLIPSEPKETRLNRIDYEPHPPWQNRSLVIISVSMFFGATVQGATMSMLTLHALQVGITNSALFFALFALMFTVGGAVSGHLSDKWGRGALVIPGFFALIIGLLALAKLQNMTTLVIGGLCTGLGLGFVNAVLLAMVPDYSVNSEDMPNDLAFFSN
ncbi:MAG: MFS transporter, partial [Firmicutes bacterium]|nr:MFS transporter [Bacillota bacterium]